MVSPIEFIIGPQRAWLFRRDFVADGRYLALPRLQKREDNTDYSTEMPHWIPFGRAYDSSGGEEKYPHRPWCHL
jgi:hypothetical protein